MPASELCQNSPPPSLDELCEKAVNLQVAGRLDLAEGLYREILLAEPLHPAANYCFGILLVHRKLPGDGLPHLLAALSQSPQVPDYWLGCLEALLLIGKTFEAANLLAAARQNSWAGPAFDDFAKRLAANGPEAASQPAAAPEAAPSAVGPTRQAAARVSRRDKPLSPRQQENQVEALIKQCRHVDALALARGLTQRYPKRAYGWKSVGVLLMVQRDTEGALPAMQTAVRLTPKDPEALRNLGVAYYEAERYIEAERYLRRALEIDPHSAALHNDLGMALSQQSRVAEALVHFRRAIALSAHEATSDSDLPRSSLLLGLGYDPTVDAESLFAEHCKAGEHIEGPRPCWPRHSNDRNADRRLQVGLVSGDFWDHSVANFIEPVLAQLRQFKGVELHAYYNNDIEDAVNARLRGLMQHWRPVLRLSDQQLSRQIMDDGIDILIDLSGHTSRNRLRMFAGKPAPVQASWIGYPGTTGLTAMDYFLADPHFLPPGQFDRQFTEKLVYLPAQAPFRPHANAPAVNPLPALASGRITFGSFNRCTKINAATIDLWSQLLRAVPTAELLIAGMSPHYPQAQMIAQFAAAGIARERLAFHMRCGMDSYLALHHQVDLCLDTFPYNGGTTNIHAVWMGVPTLTVAGATPAARQGAAILSQVALKGFTAAEAGEFVAQGVYWANHLPELAEVRQGLRRRLQDSPSRNAGVIAQALDAALRRMWQRWCAGLPPESFQVAVPASVN